MPCSLPQFIIAYLQSQCTKSTCQLGSTHITPPPQIHPTLFALYNAAVIINTPPLLQGRSYLFIPKQDASYAVWCGPVHGPDFYKVGHSQGSGWGRVCVYVEGGRRHGSHSQS